MVERCVCCGRIIPEGRMVCPVCENSEAEQISGLDGGLLTEEEEKLFSDAGENDDYYE